MQEIMILQFITGIDIREISDPVSTWYKTILINETQEQGTASSLRSRLKFKVKFRDYVLENRKLGFSNLIAWGLGEILIYAHDTENLIRV